MGANAGQTGMGLLKGGLTGLSQGLQQQNNPNPQFNFGALQQGFQTARKKPLGAGITPNTQPGNSYTPFGGGDFSL